MTNAQTTRQLGRKAMADSRVPGKGIEAEVTSNIAIAHALLDLAASIRELQPITGEALGPVNIDDIEDDNPPAPKKPDTRTTAERIRDDMRAKQ